MDSEVIANAAAGILLTAIQAMLGKDKQEAKHSEEAVVPGEFTLLSSLTSSVDDVIDVFTTQAVLKWIL